MQKIVPHLWFDREAGDAARFYTSIFNDSLIKNTTTLENTPSGTVEILTIQLSGQDFMLMSAGPFFKFTPAISFFVACVTKEEVDFLWRKLSKDGLPLMPLGSYPFSEHYGWIQDRFGLSWQVMHVGEMEIPQKITPSFLFVGGVCCKAEEAMNFYSTVFKNSEVGQEQIARYEKGEEPDVEGSIKYAPFKLLGQGFVAMDSAQDHKFAFNEAISLIVHCDTQEEIDHYWEKLSAVPEAEQCGWLKDKYGISWQIVPSEMNRMMQDKNPEKLKRVTEAFLKMKKFNISELKKAYDSV